MPLTKRQKEILDFLELFLAEYGYPPSYEEIARNFGYTSLATVHEHLENLSDKGYIRKSYNASRSIELVPMGNGAGAVELPLLGMVAAGQPIEAVQVEIDFHPFWIRGSVGGGVALPSQGPDQRARRARVKEHGPHLTLGNDQILADELARRVREARPVALLPTLTYTIIYAGQYTLFMRSAVLDIFSEDYILTAKAKGLSSLQILNRHALGNSLLPIVTIIALNLGFTVAGAIFIETVFSWPGLGQATVEAIGRRDYPMLQGTFLLLAVCVILANLIAELLYSYLDPRVQVS